MNPLRSNSALDAPQSNLFEIDYQTIFVVGTVLSATDSWEKFEIL
ncbi:MAG: hypothetical protein QNJ29_13695 [Rhizobiaceae bacterium]|nr:hypothetical protein [Rhizobiaceae bacterium]